MRTTTICRGFIAFSLLFLGHVQNTSAFTDYEGCVVSIDVEFFDLTSYQVEPYVPSVDEDGNTYLQGPALANAATNHYCSLKLDIISFDPETSIVEGNEAVANSKNSKSSFMFHSLFPSRGISNG